MTVAAVSCTRAMPGRTLMVMELTAGISRKFPPQQGMETAWRGWMAGWPLLMFYGLVAATIFGHGCHAGGHDEDDELVYRPAASESLKDAGHGAATAAP